MKRVLVFDIGGEDFGVDVEEAVEVRNPGYVWPVPDMPDYILGVIKVRGEVVPVVDMRKRFSLPPLSKNRALLVKVGGEKVGLIVDGVEGIVTLGEGDIVPPPLVFKGLKAEYIEGLGRKKERLLILLDLDRLLTSKDRIMLEAARKFAEGAAA